MGKNRTIGCDVLHKGCFLRWFFHSLHIPAFAEAAAGKMLARAQHPCRMEPTGEFVLKWGCIRESESVPTTELSACRVRAHVHGAGLQQKGELCA